MKRILSLFFVLPLACAGFACGHHSNNTDNGGDNGGGGPGAPGGGAPGAGGTGNPGDGPKATPDELAKNPIEGIAPAKMVLDAGAYTSGPIWSAGEGVLFFTAPLGDGQYGGLFRMRDDGSVSQLRTANRATGAQPIGNTILKGGKLVTFEAKRIMSGGESADAGAPTPIANGYPGEGGTAQFDTLKDGVARTDGTLYVTDPGYFGTPIANRIFRVTPQGQVSVVEAFEDVPRPNGIALSPDQKTLYVGFTQPQQGTMPFVRKYTVNADGSLGEHNKFIDVDPADSSPDGIEVDQAGNLFVACKQGIVVYKADGSKIGVVTIPEQPTAMAFAGKDLKTLYVTTGGTKIYSLTVNVPGIVQ